ncbi:putative endonuclease or glycosyl hydrolase with C2H2-type zinc finger domain [Prunus dulcis]|uniref:Putative endonuclease or glycosyl hydrolase with C2H2-type zinc finger domain n=1 Tax=Prunus dulcis TaxID=3755 RepID=A0A4Y1RY06_PRUDU|nr:putative endonuclease or glycosyl hydrolase with C2H2-type zinc finger domain [Prunus dulcis]
MKGATDSLLLLLFPSMEFNFRSLDKRSPPPLPSTLGYFSQHPHALRATQQTQTAAMIERQLEKEKIREEIMAAERRRLLEVEVRRELMLERDIVMRRAAAADGLAFDHHPRLLHHSLDHDRFAASLINNHNLLPLLTTINQIDQGTQQSQLMALLILCKLIFHLSVRLEKPTFLNYVFAAIPSLVLAWPKPCVRLHKKLFSFVHSIFVKAAERVVQFTLEILLRLNLAQFFLELSGKTPPTASASELPPTGLKKKHKEIWSCAMCQVSARSQKVFNQHLNGKKHKANEARLRAQKLDKSSSSAPLSKQTAKFSEPEEVTESLDPSDGLDEKMQDACTSKEKKEELPMQKDHCREDLKIKDEVEMVQGPGRKEAVRKKKFKFWCERCKVGAYSPKVMLAHMTGKKHIARRQEVTQSNVPIASSLASSVEASKEAEDADAAKEAHEKIPTESAMSSSGTNANGKAENADLTKEANNTAKIVVADTFHGE